MENKRPSYRDLVSGATAREAQQSSLPNDEAVRMPDTDHETQKLDIFTFISSLDKSGREILFNMVMSMKKAPQSNSTELSPAPTTDANVRVHEITEEPTVFESESPTLPYIRKEELLDERTTIQLEATAVLEQAGNSDSMVNGTFQLPAAAKLPDFSHQPKVSISPDLKPEVEFESRSNEALSEGVSKSDKPSFRPSGRPSDAGRLPSQFRNSLVPAANESMEGAQIDTNDFVEKRVKQDYIFVDSVVPAKNEVVTPEISNKLKTIKGNIETLAANEHNNYLVNKLHRDRDEKVRSNPVYRSFRWAFAPLSAAYEAFVDKSSEFNAGEWTKAPLNGLLVEPVKSVANSVSRMMSGEVEAYDDHLRMVTKAKESIEQEFQKRMDVEDLGYEALAEYVAELSHNNPVLLAEMIPDETKMGEFVSECLDNTESDHYRRVRFLMEENKKDILRVRNNDMADWEKFETSYLENEKPLLLEKSRLLRIREGVKEAQGVVGKTSAFFKELFKGKPVVKPVEMPVEEVNTKVQEEKKSGWFSRQAGKFKNLFGKNEGSAAEVVENLAQEMTKKSEQRAATSKPGFMDRMAKQGEVVVEAMIKAQTGKDVVINEAKASLTEGKKSKSRWFNKQATVGMAAVAAFAGLMANHAPQKTLKKATPFDDLPVITNTKGVSDNVDAKIVMPEKDEITQIKPEEKITVAEVKTEPKADVPVAKTVQKPKFNKPSAKGLVSSIKTSVKVKSTERTADQKPATVEAHDNIVDPESRILSQAELDALQKDGASRIARYRAATRVVYRALELPNSKKISAQDLGVDVNKIERLIRQAESDAPQARTHRSLTGLTNVYQQIDTELDSANKKRAEALLAASWQADHRLVTETNKMVIDSISMLRNRPKKFVIRYDEKASNNSGTNVVAYRTIAVDLVAYEKEYTEYVKEMSDSLINGNRLSEQRLNQINARLTWLNQQMAFVSHMLRYQMNSGKIIF